MAVHALSLAGRADLLAFVMAERGPHETVGVALRERCLVSRDVARFECGL